MTRKGIPNFEATAQERTLIKAAASVGVTHEQMRLMIKREVEGELVPISTDTLTRHFDEELAVGKVETIVLVGSRLVSTALGKREGAAVADELRAQMFYLKTQAGWREVERQEVVFPGIEEEDAEAAVVAGRVSGIIERGLRRAAAGGRPKKDGQTLQ